MAAPSFFFEDNNGNVCEWKVYQVTPNTAHLVFWRRQDTKIDVYAGFSTAFGKDGLPIAWGLFHTKHSHTCYVLKNGKWECRYKRTLEKQRVIIRNPKRSAAKAN